MKIAIAAVLFAVSFSAAAEKPCADILVDSGMFQSKTFTVALLADKAKAASLVEKNTAACEAIKEAARIGIKETEIITMLVDQQDVLRAKGVSEEDLALVFKMNMAAYDSVK